MARILLILMLACQMAKAQFAPFMLQTATVAGCNPSDNFPASALSANWTVANGTWTTTGDVCNLTSLNADGQAFWNACNPAANQWAQMTIKAMSSAAVDQDVALVLRGTGTGASFTGYVIMFNTDEYRVFRVVGDVYTTINTTAQVFAVNDVVKASVSGTGATVTIQVFRSGAQVGSDVTDTNAARIVAANHQGIAGYNANGTVQLDTWSAGDL